MLALVLLAVSALLVFFLLQARRSRPPRRGRTNKPPTGPNGYRFQPKPPWVRGEVLRLKALLPQAGVRTLASTFNQLHASQRKTTVGKSYVANVLRGSQEEVMRLRREIRRRRPRATARNQVWALDLTFAPLDSGGTEPVLGVIDHGTRACLTLERLGTRTTIGVLRKLLDLIERFGKPRAVRTDNEALFTSKLARACLALLGIRHQRIERCAPWQNGRVERFFGTFKRALRELRDKQLTPEDLATFRTWYNHLRPHQGLNGLTPAQAWQGEALPPAARRKPVFLTAWRGVLRGFYVPK
jgi:putative transposase